jgi:hypothetical protein
MDDRTIEINQFKLLYDGLFKIEFEYNEKKCRECLYLTPSMLLKTLKNEGLEDADAIQKFHLFSDDLIVEGINFSKTTLLFRVFDEEDDEISFLTSQRAEHYQNVGLYLIDCEIKEC